MQTLSPEEEVVHQFTTVAVVCIELWQIVAYSFFLFSLCCSLIALCTSLVDGMRLVMTGFSLTVVRQVAVLTFSQIGDTRILTRDGIRTMGILIVSVGIIVVHILHSLLVFICAVALACTQIISVQIVGNLTIFEVVERVILPNSIDIVNDRLIRR